MGAFISVHHLAVVPPGFFNVLARRTTHLLDFAQASLHQRMSGLDTSDPGLMHSDEEAMARQFNIRHFVRQQGPVERKLPVASIESFNSVPEQNLFALAAVLANAAGPQASRDLCCMLHNQTDTVPPERRLELAEKLGYFAQLPKTRLRLPSGAQHLLADPVEALLEQTADLNQRLLEVGLCGYAPKGADLSFPNTPASTIDRDDALAQGGLVRSYVQRDQMEAGAEAGVALSFSQLTASRQRGIELIADLGCSQFIPKSMLMARGGACYLLGNSPEALAQALNNQPEKTRISTLVTPRKALM